MLLDRIASISWVCFLPKELKLTFKHQEVLHHYILLQGTSINFLCILLCISMFIWICHFSSVRNQISSFFGIKITFCSLRFKISQEGVKDVEVIKSSYKPKISNDEEMDQVYEHTLEIDPAIHMLVQHGADVNMKDRSVKVIVTRYFAKTHF